MSNKPFIPFRDPQHAEKAEYSANLKQVAQQTLETNQKEIAAIEQQLGVLQQEPFEPMRLPILAHTFILLDPPHRFALMSLYIDLLQSLYQRIKQSGGDTAIILQAIATAKDVKADDTPDNYPTNVPFDTSQFLTQYHTTRMAHSMMSNHHETKLQNKIRQHIIKSYQQSLMPKKRAVENCNNVLSKKLYGES
jgi:hypothetical protein